MKFKLLRLWTFLIFFCVVLSSHAYDIEVDGFYYETNLENMTATLVSGELAYSGNITIPKEVTYKGRTFSVVGIDGAFTGCSELTNVTFPNSIVYLGAKTFEHCTKLRTINKMESIEQIGPSCFSGCSSLISISIPKELKIIPAETFNGCSSLTELIIPENIDSIGNKAFQDCFNLETIKLPTSFTTLSNSLFKNCKSLRSINIPSSITLIEDEVFRGCQNLESIYIPNSVIEIDNMVFNECSKLKNIYFENGQHLLSIGYGQKDSNRVFGLFYGIPIEELYLGRDLEYPNDEGIYIHLDDYQTYYHGYAPFQSCGLKNVTISNTVTRIRPYTFYNCTQLQNIDIPSSVTSIGDNAFAKSGLLTLTFMDGYDNLAFDMKISNTKDDFTPHTFSDCNNLNKVYIGRNIVVGNISSSGSSSPATFLPTCVEEIEIGNFVNELSYLQLYNQKISSSLSHYSNLKSIKFGCCLIEIPSLSNNEKLTNLTLCSPIPIKSYAFSNTQYMDLIPVIPIGSVNKYKESDIWCNFWEFQESENLHTNIIYHDDYAYGIIDTENNLGLLKGPKEFSGDIIVPETIIYNDITYKVISIGSEFKNANNLVSIILPKSITELYADCFYNCTALQSVELSEELTSIGSYAFYNCTSLKKLSIPATVTSFGSHAFEKSWIEYLRFEDGDIPLNLPSSSQTSEFRNGSHNYTGYIYTNLGYFSETSIVELYLGRDLEQKPGVSVQYGGTSYFTRTDDPFYSVSQLETVTIGPKVKRVGSNLREASSNGITVSNRTGFSNCNNVRTVISEANNPPVGAAFTSNAYNYGNLTVPSCSKDLYSSAEGWSKFKKITEVSSSAEAVILNIEKAFIGKGESIQLKATVFPEDATNKTIIWSSDNEEIATVSETGLVYGAKIGKTTITAKCGEVSAQCEVNVTENDGVESILNDDNTLFNVYTPAGILIKEGLMGQELKTLAPGIYIIHSPKGSCKVQI